MKMQKYQKRARWRERHAKSRKNKQNECLPEKIEYLLNFKWKWGRRLKNGRSQQNEPREIENAKKPGNASSGQKIANTPWIRSENLSDARKTCSGLGKNTRNWRKCQNVKSGHACARGTRNREKNNKMSVFPKKNEYLPNLKWKSGRRLKNGSSQQNEHREIENAKKEAKSQVGRKLRIYRTSVVQ